MSLLTIVDVDRQSEMLKEEFQPTLRQLLLIITNGLMVALSSLAQIFNSITKYVQNLTGPTLHNVPEVPGYPVLGILPQMCSEGLYSATMSRLFDAAQDCGISCSSAGTVPIIFLRDPAIIRQVLVQNSDNITRFAPDGTGPFGIMQRITGNIAASADGKDWHRWRKGFLKEFSNPTALRRSYDDMLRLAKKHVQKMIVDKSGADLCQAMEGYALDTVWSVTLGADNISESASEFLSVMSGYGAIVGNPSHLWRHYIRNILSGKAYREPDHVEQSVGNGINRVLGRLLDQHLANINPEEPLGEGNFLRSTSKESGGSDEAPITEDVLAQARQVFSLGHEAPTLLLFWAIYELSLHPEAIEKLRHEIRENRRDHGDLDFDTIRTMPYLDAVTTELLRLHAPISSTARMVTRPIVVETRSNDTVILPPGAHLFASVHLLHHDKQVWGDNADEFLPERWIGLRASTAESRCEFLPFLAGPRGCPSASFVTLQMKTMLAVLLSQVDIELPNSSGLEKLIDGVVRPAKSVNYEVREVCI
ncbi:Putative cytochrome P450 [Tolypocladium paradoxum]|uniref:Cytochrome P450 n=1 Tax=Tolypocladium paradoxum TaxID=94208 RepID=A0A2S4L2D7_9HYPO|nr:Putative cytochrome P450 [Tolypocladium paradoxum]